MATPLLSLVAADSTPDFDGHNADPGRIHTAAKNVGVVDQFEKMILEGAVLVVQLVLQRCWLPLEQTRWCRKLLAQLRTLVVNHWRKHFGIQRRETLSPPTL